MANREDSKYKVFAVKYRPQTFDDLIGQDVLVQTLRNAFASNRIANGYMLTGIRGIGKTTSARIIAKALNCESGVSGNPCGKCDTCIAIAQDRHIDVVEIDAASNTGVDNMREIIDAAMYKPVMARYKVYIIDEVHMLSKSAFNALLKTLEEPPEHVKFIFATTEIRKVPVTILSRTQRFDLKRIDSEALAAHMQKLVDIEQIPAESAALEIIAKAADGSSRDSLSLLDQAVVYGQGKIETDAVKDMLGMSDRTLSVRLFKALMSGNSEEALAIVQNIHTNGGEPYLIISDLLELNYKTTRAKLGFKDSEVAGFTDASMADLAIIWQALLKGLSDIKIAPNSLHALEMLMLRIIYMTGIVQQEPAQAQAAVRAPQQQQPQAAAGSHVFKTFMEVADYADSKGEGILTYNLQNYVRVSDFADGAIQCSLEPDAPKGLILDLQAKLQQWTGKPWNIKVESSAAAGSGGGAMTLKEQIDKKDKEIKQQAAKDPLVKEALSMFAGANISKVSANDEPSPDSEGGEDEHG